MYWGIASPRDASHLPQIFSQELKSFWRSMEGLVVGSSRSCPRPNVPASVCTWRTVFLVGTVNPHGASWPGVLRVHRVFLSVFVSIRLASCSGLEEFGGPFEDMARTVCYLRCTTGGSDFFFRLSIRDQRTVCPYHVDRPPGHCGLSAWCLAELLSLLLLESCFRFGIVWSLVPTVGRSIVTT
jgi:hypothetical protein